MATQSMVGTFRVKIVFVITLQLIFSDCFGQEEVLENSCDPPEAVEHANLLRKFIQRENFAHGESVEYRCSPGALFRGSSLKRTCENGQWSTALLDCQLMPCPYIPNPKNGRKLDDNRLPGESTVFECLPGYIMKGPKELLCRVDWEWRPSKPPICEPVMCPALYGIRHGRIFQETDDLNNDYGSVVEYTCDFLFVLKGNKYRVCGQDGRWSGEAPKCVEPFCPDYEERLHNGIILYEHDKRLVDTFAFFRCNSDSDLFPSRPTSAECLPSQTWSPARLPKCLKKAEINFSSNTKYYLMKNGNMIKYIRKKDPPLQHGTQITVLCRNGYELKWRSYLNTPSFVSTNKNGTWDPYIPYCVKARCNIANIVNNVHTMVWYDNGTKVKEGLIEHNVKIHENCSELYEMNRRLQTFSDTCDKGRISLKTCKPKSCSSESLPKEHTEYGSFGEISNDYYSHTEKTIVSCNPNTEYELVDEETGLYMKDFQISCHFGQWTPVNIPVCIEKHCELKVTGGLDIRKEGSDDEHVYTGNVNISSGTTVLTDCKKGYQMFNGPKKVERKRVKNVCFKGVWSENILCTPKPCKLPKILFGKYLNRDGHGEFVKHGSKVEFGCNTGYDMILREKVIKSFSSRCEFEEWDKNVFPECKPRGCELTILSGTLYTIENIPVEESTKVDHGTTVEVGCYYDYEMTDEKGHIYEFDNKKTKCHLGEWINKLFCKKRQCSLANKPDGWIITDQNGLFISSGEKVFAECGKKYENQNVTLTCNGSELQPSWPECVERGCVIQKDENAVYSTEEDEVVAGQQVNISCTHDYELYDKKSNKFANRDQVEMICREGELNNFYTCKERRCRNPGKNTNLVLMKNKKKVQDNSFTWSGKKMKITCREGYTLSGDKRETTCNRGVWNPDLPGCIKYISETTAITVVMKTNTTFLPTEGKRPAVVEEKEKTDNTSASHEEDIEKINSESVDNEIDSEQKGTDGSINSSSKPTTVSKSFHLSEITSTSKLSPSTKYSEAGKPMIDEETTRSSTMKSTTVDRRGCWTPKDLSISPQLEDGTEVDPGVWVDEGTVLHISCLMDYDFLNDTILCGRDGTWNLTDAFCPESDFELSSDCPPLSNGEVLKLDNGLNKLQCNKGFTLNFQFCETTRCSENSFTCGKALCTPDDCEIPGKLDPIMSIFSGGLSLSSRSTVKHGDSITLHCLLDGYVPTAKQLHCSAGKFVPELKTNSCEKAKCDNCTYGTCIDHGQCECNEGYIGEHCNKAICQIECTENGGYCSKPYICKCPEGKDGIDCSKPMCAMPDTNALFNPKQDWYSINSTLIGACDDRHTLTGNPSITCQKSGLWFGFFYCEPLPAPVMYRFDIYTGDSTGTGTNANVEITIIGKEGRVTFKLDRDLDYHWRDDKLFENNVRDRFLINNNINTGKVTEIILRHDGAGTFPTWYVTKVTLYVNQTEEFYHFNVDKWISSDQSLTIKSERSCKFDVEGGYPGGHPMKIAVRTWKLWECNIVCSADVGCVGTVHRNDECSLLFYKPRRISPSSNLRTSLKMCDSNMNT